MSDKVHIFDTTLRDGEQCPGASMNFRQKMEVARQLERMGVDIIEAGFPVISDGDFESVYAIASEITKCRIAGLSRCVEGDIKATAKAVAPAGDRGRIHVVLATSKIHRDFKLKKSSDDIIRMAVEGVSFAKSFTHDVEFSSEDASRTEPEFLSEVVQAVIEAGATTVNIPDTVGYTTPDEFYYLITYLKQHVPNIEQAILSVHCHNDLGLAVANSLAAIKAGARQVEGAINGIGERAGNAALEEIIMGIKVRGEQFGGVHTDINFKEIVKTSRLVSRMSSMQVQRSKAIVGENAFAHGSGIHQDGIIKKRETYEIINPEDVGWGVTELPLTKHSGRHAVKIRLEHLGYHLSTEELASVFERFKQIGDRKKFVYDDDLAALVDVSLEEGGEDAWNLDSLQFIAGTTVSPTATVKLSKGEEVIEDSATGNGAVDAVCKAIDRVTQLNGALVDYEVNATSEGQDSVGEVTVKVSFGDGCQCQYTGKGASTDVIEASGLAYLNAANRYIQSLSKGQKVCDTEIDRGNP